MIKILNTIDKYLNLTIIFLYPLFFLPIFQNMFETAKLLLLVVGVLLIAIVKIAKILVNKELKINISKLDLFVVGFALTYLVSGIFMSPNRMDAFLYPGIASFVIFGSILYFFVNQFEREEKGFINLAISLSAVIYGIIELLSFTGILKDNFTNFGNIINSFVFLLVALSISSFEIIKQKKIVFKIFFGVLSFIIFVSTFTSFYSLLPNNKTSPILPSYKISWPVSIDSIKQSPFLGVGPSNFLESYNRYRPLESNSTKSWNVKFLVASNTILTLLSEVGIIGFVFFISLFVISFISNKNLNPYKLGLFFILIISSFYPFSPALMPLILIFLAMNNEPKEVKGIFTSIVPLILIMIPIVALIIATIFYGYKAFYGEYLFGKAIKIIKTKDALKSYESINKTVLFNPYVDRYHLTSAEIKMSIAQNLSKKESLTEEDKKTLSELIQQAIEESKATVSLNPKNASSWETLGNIYVNISPFAKDSMDFAVQSYNQAISLDPINPLLRIKLGGIYYAEGKFEEASKIFELAVVAKSDYANSHFNLAMAYKGNKQFEKAKEQINIVLKLVDSNSEDYQIAKKEFENIDSVPQVEIPQE